MDLPYTEAIIATTYLDTCGSTNDEVKKIIASGNQQNPHLLITAQQTAGRGRLGRAWQENPNHSLATSIFLPELTSKYLDPSWLPLIAGAALSQALKPLLQVSLKWPNDVLVPAAQEDNLASRRGGAKLCGVLCEMLPGVGYIVGAGINVYGDYSQLPEGAISLAAAGATPVGTSDLSEQTAMNFADELLARYVRYVLDLWNTGGQSAQAWVNAQKKICDQIATVGHRVRALLPDGKTIVGLAEGLGDSGDLLVRGVDNVLHSLSAADVEHLRTDF